MTLEKNDAEVTDDHDKGEFWDILSIDVRWCRSGVDQIQWVVSNEIYMPEEGFRMTSKSEKYKQTRESTGYVFGFLESVEFCNILCVDVILVVA